VDVGLGAAAARALNQPFFTLMREHRPFVVLKAAMSVDGYIAEAPGTRTRLTSSEANRHAHRVRAEIDAIGVGAGTILADDPELTARGAFRERPLVRVIFDRRLRTPADAAVLSTSHVGPVIIMTSVESARNDALRQPLEARGASIEPIQDVTLRAALGRLADHHVESLLLEAARRCMRRRGTKAWSTSSTVCRAEDDWNRAACRSRWAGVSRRGPRRAPGRIAGSRHVD